MNITTYPMGSYSARELGLKTHIGANRGHKTHLKVRRERRNMYYAKHLTKYQVERRVNYAITTAIILITIMTGYAINFYAVRSFQIVNSVDTSVGADKVDASTGVIADSARAVITDNIFITSSVENPDIAEIKKYEWKKITVGEAIAIVNCESSFINEKSNISSASGKWMFTSDTWTEGVHARGLNWTLYDRFDFIKATNMAHWYIETKGQVARWDCARILKIK